MSTTVTCGGQEVEISDEKEAELKQAIEELQLAQEEHIKSEMAIQKQIQRKHYHDLSGWDKFKMLLGWDPNGH